MDWMCASLSVIEEKRRSKLILGVHLFDIFGSIPFPGCFNVYMSSKDVHAAARAGLLSSLHGSKRPFVCPVSASGKGDVATDKTIFPFQV